MSNKTRKHIWPGALVLSIGIVGVLAAFLVLTSSPGGTQAHGEWVEGTAHCPETSDKIAHEIGGSAFDHTCDEGPNQAPMAPTATLANLSIDVGGMGTAQSTITDADADDTLDWTVSSTNSAVADARVSITGLVTVTGVAAGTATITVTATDPDGASDMQTFTVTVNAPDPSGGEPVSYVIEGPDFVLQDRQKITRYTINVLDEDGNPADFALRPGSEEVTVYLDVVDTAQGDVGTATACLPEVSNAIVRDNMEMLLDSCSFTLDVSEPDPWFEIVASTIHHGTDVGITLEVDGDPVGDTHTITFLNPAQPTDIRILNLCIRFDRNGGAGMIEVEVVPSNTDEDLITGIEDHYMVVVGPNGNLATTDGSMSTRTGALMYEREFSSQNVDDEGLLMATFSGAMNDTTYNVRVFTLEDDGSIDVDSIMTGYVHVTK